MTHQEISQVLQMLNNPEPELAICQNPKCMDAFNSVDGEIFCPECDCHLSEIQKWNIRFAIEHDINPDRVLGVIFNPEEGWNP